ncbi:MAG: hypothetical protein OXE87_16675 [Chloroflexi bacterium]|nr:hypothetical protein [Chloroflexota bacterium]
MLKRKWQTSIKMMIHRAQDLSIVDREEARRLYVLYGRRGWNSAEPYDDDPVEEPRLLRRMFEMIIENSIIDRQQIAAALPFKTDEIEQLTNLPHGFLEDDSAYNWAINQLNSGFASSG